MKFIHTSDWHIGFRQYNIETRFHDFARAVLRSVDRIIKLEPDFVLHTGDLFHDNRPTAGSIRVAVRALVRLKKAGIPVYMIRGNHDTHENAKGGSVMHLLEELDLICFVNNEIKSFESTDIIGINYHPAKALPQTLTRLIDSNIELIRDDSRFTILALHNFIEGQLEGEHNFEVSMTRLSEYGFNYIGGGHYHIPWKREKYNIYTPGSSEATSSNDWRREDSEGGINIFSSFYLVETEKKDGVWIKPRVSEQRVPVRPKIFGEINSEASTLEELETEIRQFISEKLTQLDRLIENIPEYDENTCKPLLNLKIETDLDETTISKIDRANLLQNFLDPSRIEITSHSVVELPDISNSGEIIATTMRELMMEVESEVENLSNFSKFVDQIMSELTNVPKSKLNKMEEETIEDYVSKAVNAIVEGEI